MRALANSLLKTAFTVLLLSVGAFGCQPCQSTLTLEQSARKAELTIVGQRVDYSPKEVNRKPSKCRC